MAESVRQGDTGVAIVKTVTEDGSAVDISTATTLLYVFEGPYGERTTLTPTFVTDGTNGQLTATSTATTWTCPGTWKEQVQVTTPAGTWSTVEETRTVQAKL